VIVSQGFHRCQVVERHTDEAFQQRRKAFLHLGIGGGGQGRHGAAMEAAFHNDHGGAGDLFA